MSCQYCPHCKGKGPTKYILEATWSGYRSSQARVCHRVFIKPKQVEQYKKITGFRFTDGTSMTITVRPHLPREKVQIINSYPCIQTAYYKKLEGFLDIVDERLK